MKSVEPIQMNQVKGHETHLTRLFENLRHET